MRGCVALAAVTAALLAAGSAAAAGGPRIAVGTAACAGGIHGWQAPRSGRTVFTVRNTSADNFFLVQIVARNSATTDARYGFLLGKVYGEISLLAPKTARGLAVLLPPGSYFFRCLDRAGNMNVSSIEAVHGKPVHGAHPYEPLAGSQLPLAMLRYRLSVAPIFKRLVTDTDRLARAVRAGKLAQARQLWLPAHLDYARLGAAYGTFGNLDAQIDGQPFGLQRGVHDRDFQGFLRLEYGLWHHQSGAVLAPVATALAKAVRTLRTRAAAAKTVWVDTDLPLRTHEILENTLQFELTGDTNEGSGTNLATAWANAQGTLLTLDALRPLLKHGRDPKLVETAVAQTRRLAAAYAAYRGRSGRWRPLASLSRLDRERLDSRTSALLETLERIPGELKAIPPSPSSSE